MLCVHLIIYGNFETTTIILNVLEKETRNYISAVQEILNLGTQLNLATRQTSNRAATCIQWVTLTPHSLLNYPPKTFLLHNLKLAQLQGTLNRDRWSGQDAGEKCTCTGNINFGKVMQKKS